MMYVEMRTTRYTAAEINILYLIPYFIIIYCHAPANPAQWLQGAGRHGHICKYSLFYVAHDSLSIHNLIVSAVIIYKDGVRVHFL